MADLPFKSIKKTAQALRKGEITAREITQSCIDNIKEKDGDVFSFLEVYDDALERADKIDGLFKKGGNHSDLCGIPIAFKDNILIKGKHSSAGSKILEGFRSPYHSTVARKLESEGAVFLGRTNMDEFAMGSSTENSAFGPTKNPHDLERVPGGSSGGSAAAVALGGAMAALGSDTGGSVRQPAGFCGVVGFKPTYGAISRHGLIAMGSSLDQIGPLTNSVEDAEVVFESLRGRDPLDSNSIDIDPSQQNKRSDLRIGVPSELIYEEGVDEKVIENFKDSLNKLKNLGFDIVETSLPDIKYSLAVYYIIMPAEVSANLARFDGVKYGSSIKGQDLMDTYLKTRGEGFGKEVRRRIMIGTYVLSSGYKDAYYNKARAVRRLISSNFSEAFRTVDVIATPTSPTVAFKLGEKKEDPLTMYLSDIFTVPANIAELPAISIPSGQITIDGKSLPTALHLTAPRFGESILFDIGKAFERK